MDFGTALANSIGMFLDFDETTVGCQVQAAFAIFCSLSSYLWTAAIAVYIYITIVRGQHLLASRLVKIFHVLAWGIPAVIVSVAGGLDILGYDTQIVHSENESLVTATVTGGWCYIRGPYKTNTTSEHDHDLPLKWYNKTWYKFWVMVAGGAWEIGTFLFCLCVYVIIKIHMYREKHQTFVTRESFRVASVVDRKLVFIPIVFFILHIWSSVRDIARFDNKHSVTNAKWLLAAEGIGDSLQGAANGVMFCVFTAVVRHRFSSALGSCCHIQKQQKSINPNRTTGKQGGNVSDGMAVVLIFR
jgi:G protein-coupled receptor 157